jgi:hypothetical protein
MDMRIEQALLGGERPLRSPGFRDDWLAEAGRLREAFGQPADALFARPLSGEAFAVAHVHGALMRVLAVPMQLFQGLEGDVFAIADTFPPDWTVQGQLQTLEWTTGPLPRRMVADLSRVLNTTADRSAALLGATQALLDGGRVAFERAAPDAGMLRGLWALLPSATRSELTLATYAPNNSLGFHALVAPQVSGPEFTGYVREEEACEYPEGNYEYSLQEAVESGDQDEVDRLLARRSGTQMMRLALILLAVVALVALLTQHPFSQPEPKEKEEPPAAKKEE